MNVSHDISARTFGNDVDAEFEDMDANGEHGLALALIATATDVLDHRSRDAFVERVEELVAEYQARTTPVQYV